MNSFVGAIFDPLLYITSFAAVFALLASVTISILWLAAKSLKLLGRFVRAISRED